MAGRRVPEIRRARSSRVEGSSTPGDGRKLDAISIVEMAFAGLNIYASPRPRSPVLYVRLSTYTPRHDDPRTLLRPNCIVNVSRTKRGVKRFRRRARARVSVSTGGGLRANDARQRRLSRLGQHEWAASSGYLCVTLERLNKLRKRLLY